MNIDPHREKIYQISKAIVKYSPGEDHRDLAHDVFLKLLSMEEPTKCTDSWIATICHNLWRDRIRYKNLRRDEGHLFNMISVWSMFETRDPDIELTAKELGLNLEDWPGAYKPNNPKRLALYEALMRN